MKSKPKKVCQRNHVALALLARGGSSKVHGRSEKASRTQAKAQVKKGELQ